MADEESARSENNFQQFLHQKQNEEWIQKQLENNLVQGLQNQRNTSTIDTSSLRDYQNIVVGGNNSDIVLEWDIEIFITEMEAYSCLWNTEARSHHDSTMRNNSWEELSEKFGQSVTFLKGQWKNLRDNFKRCVTRRAQMSKSEAASHTLPKCKYFIHLQFLYEKVTNKETGSNFVSQPSSPAASSISDVTDISLPSPVDNPKIQTTTPSIKRKRQLEDKAKNFDSQFADVMKDVSDATTAIAKDNKEHEEDEDCLFFRSLCPTLKRLPARENRIAKMKIQKVLFDLEFKELSTN